MSLRKNEMPKIVHIVTKLEVTFGLLDDDLDVSQTMPFSLALGKLNAENFTIALKQITDKKAELEAQLDAQLKPASDNDV